MPVPLTRIARDIFGLLSANIVARAVGIGALVVYARILSPHDLAAIPVFLILGSFTTIPFNFGLYPTLIREVPPLLETRPERALGLIRTTMITVSIGVLIAGVVYLALADGIANLFLHDAGEGTLIRWMSAGTVARGADEIITYVLRATREFGALTRKKLVSEVSQPILALALIGPLGVRGLIVGLTIGLVIGVVVGVYGARAHLWGPAEGVPLLPVVRRSLPYYLEGAVFFVTQMGDQALVGALLAPPALAGYYIARRIPDALGLILYAIEEVMGPTLARAKLDSVEHFRRTFAALALGIGAFTLTAGAMAAALAHAYLTIIGSDRYAGLLPAVVILALGIIPQGAITVVSQVALALGHPSDRLKITTVFATALLALTALTAQRGITAVALGRDGALLFTVGVGIWVARELLPPVPWRELVKLLIPVTVLGMTLFALQSLNGNVWLVPLEVLGAFGIAGVTLLLTVGTADRARLRKAWQRIHWA